MKEEAYRALVDDGERSTSIMDADVVPENTYLCVHTDNELNYDTNRGCTQAGMSRIYFRGKLRSMMESFCGAQSTAVIWEGNTEAGDTSDQDLCSASVFRGLLLQFSAILHSAALVRVGLPTACTLFYSRNPLLHPKTSCGRLPSVITIHYIYSCYC